MKIFLEIILEIYQQANTHIVLFIASSGRVPRDLHPRRVAVAASTLGEVEVSHVTLFALLPAETLQTRTLSVRTPTSQVE